MDTRVQRGDTAIYLPSPVSYIAHSTLMYEFLQQVEFYMKWELKRVYYFVIIGLSKLKKISTFGKVNLVKFRITVNTVPAQSLSLKSKRFTFLMKRAVPPLGK